MLRAFTRAKLRTLPVYNSGDFQGTPWSNWTIEVLDEDDNKVTFRVPSQEFGQGLVVGESYTFTFDANDSGKARFTVVAYEPVAKSARSAA